MSILIRDATVITMDTKLPLINKGAVFVENSLIADVGTSADLMSRYSNVETVIDGVGKIVLPGFVSTHNHLGYAAFRGMAEDVGSKPTPSLYLPMGQIMNREERQAIGSLAAAELLRGGTTTILEMEEDADVLAPFIDKLGLRAGISIMSNDVDVGCLLKGETVFSPELRSRQIEQSRRLAEDWHGQGSGRIQALMAANMAMSCSAELLAEIRALADKFGTKITYHIGLGDYESELVQRLHGKTSFQFARDNGFLGDDVIAVHCHTVSSADINMMAETGTSIAHCPQVNALRGTAAPLLDFLSARINVGLGIDNYFSDYYEVIRACIYIARVRAGSSQAMLAHEALAMATLSAARVMGLDKQVGSIEKGKKADLQMVETRSLGLTPVTDPVSNLVYHAHTKDVTTVIVDGKIVVDKGKLLTADESELVSIAAEAAQQAWGRFNQQYGLTDRFVGTELAQV